MEKIDGDKEMNKRVPSGNEIAADAHVTEKTIDARECSSSGRIGCIEQHSASEEIEPVKESAVSLDLLKESDSSLDLLRNIEKKFDLPTRSIRQYSPLTLAYIGDAIYEVIIRTILVREANEQVNKLHRKATGYVKAERQSAMIDVLEPIFTEEEAAVYHRGRNANAHTKAKNASIQEYRRATGFEAVMGYLYLDGQTDRMLELVKIGLDKTE